MGSWDSGRNKIAGSSLYDSEEDYYRPLMINTKQNNQKQNNQTINNYFKYKELGDVLKYYPIELEMGKKKPSTKTIKTKKTKTKLSMDSENDKKLLKDDGTLYSMGYYKLADLVEMSSTYNIDVYNI